MKHFTRIGAAVALLIGLAGGAHAADTASKVEAVASFSILGDMVREVGGDRIAVTTLVGPDGDTHVFSPTPADAKALASAKLFFVNGLGFEGWMDRLVKASDFKGDVVVTSDGITPRHLASGEGHDTARRITPITPRPAATTMTTTRRRKRRKPIRMRGKALPMARSMLAISATR